MTLDYVGLNIEHTIILMKDFLNAHSELLVRNSSDLASVTAIISSQYARFNLFHYLWLIGQSFTSCYPMPLAPYDAGLVDQVAELNKDRPLQRIEINLERRELICQTTGRVFTNSFDCFLSTSPLATTISAM